MTPGTLDSDEVPRKTSQWRGKARLATILMLAVVALGGCATAQRPDPLEPMNRKIFAFNEGVDKAVVKPVATAYKTVLPDVVRTGVTNFFSNLSDPWSAANLLLQGRVKDGLSDLGRFGTNTVVGVLGFVDVATRWGMPRHGEDFGQTLGAWGVGSGAYLVLPLLGPSTLRDSAALPVDFMAAPQGHVSDVPVRNSLMVVERVNQRANLLQAGQLLDDLAFDRYLFLRDAYLQRRSGLVHDADPPFDPSRGRPELPKPAKDPENTGPRALAPAQGEP